MKNGFGEQLSLLNRELTRLGAICKGAVALAAKSRICGDHAVNIAKWVDFSVVGKHKGGA